MEGQVGDLTVKSSVGKVTLRRLFCSGDSLDVHTDVGNMVIALQSLPARRMNVGIMVGSVRAGLPTRARAHVKMVTGVGGLTSEFPLTSPKHGIGHVGEEMFGDLNGGGVPIEITVGTGGVRLYRDGH